MTSTSPIDHRSHAAAPVPRRAWVVTGLLVAFMLINFGDKALLGLAAKPLMNDLDLTADEYGTIASAFYALFSVSAVVVGFLANRISSRWLILVMSVAWAVTQIPVVVFATAGSLLVSRIVLGATEGPANPIAVNAVQKWFPDERRNLPTALINVGAALGVVVLSPVLTYLIVEHGWRSAFVLMAVLGLAWSTLWLMLGREGSEVSHVTAPVSETARGRHRAGRARVPYRAIFFSGTGVSVFVAGAAVYWSLAILVAWLPLYLDEPLGLGPARAGTLVALPWVASAIVIPVQGIVTDRLMRHGVSSRLARGVLGGVCVTAAGVSMLLITVAPGTLLKLVLVTLAFSVGTVQFAVGMTMMAEIAPDRQRAAVLATVIGTVGLAGMVSPAVTGRFVDAHGMGSVDGFHSAFVLAGALMMAGGLLSLLLARPERDAQRLRGTVVEAHEDEAREE
ncbi:Sugar phosphate permease [Nocardioides sp. YR527]|uniref:MFS transporter n=1 Tax=Nocardioides sp. YR527 TaxID=1881028 RepID=UPI000881D7AF|nr:MFS transporter [Nocardioides sp. YR527]SDK72795.1 Sugar phosphate permease [Nocardioides sp. YR527]